MGCGPIRARPIGPDFIRAANFTARPSKISGQFGPAHRARPIFPSLASWGHLPSPLSLSQTHSHSHRALVISKKYFLMWKVGQLPQPQSILRLRESSSDTKYSGEELYKREKYSGEELYHFCDSEDCSEFVPWT